MTSPSTRPTERPSRAEMEAARERLRGVIVRTPLVPLHAHGRESHVLLKPEILQPAGSFKIRGVYHAVLSMSEAERARGLSTVSAGNTAKALAWCGQRFGVPAYSLMPETAPRAKIDAVRALGGTPRLVPIAEVFRFLREHSWEKEPYSFVDPWTDPRVIAGHASLGLEILEDAADIESVYVPVGGGGLLAGVGSAIRAVNPRVRVIAVEPAGCPSLHAAIQAGHPVTVDCHTMCDGVAVPYITEEMFPLLRDLADEVVLVTEEEVRSAIRLLASANHLIAEGAGALATAAACKHHHPAGRGRAVSILTGGSLDPAKLAEILTEAPPAAAELAGESARRLAELGGLEKSLRAPPRRRGESDS